MIRAIWELIFKRQLNDFDWGGQAQCGKTFRFRFYDDETAERRRRDGFSIKNKVGQRHSLLTYKFL